jgi:hypothetical protein
MVLNVVGASVVPVGGGLSRNAAGLVEYLDQACAVRMLRQTEGPLVVPANAGRMPGLLGRGAGGACGMAVTLLEVCVDTAAGLAAAVRGGADRIELCAALDGRADALGRADADRGGLRACRCWR